MGVFGMGAALEIKLDLATRALDEAATTIEALLGVLLRAETERRIEQEQRLADRDAWMAMAIQMEHIAEYITRAEGDRARQSEEMRPMILMADRTGEHM